MLDFFTHVRGIIAQERSNTDVRNVLLLGPEGVEKEEVAKAIHQLSGREGFAHIKCSELEEDLQRIVGSYQYGGTVFVAEIDQLPTRWRTSMMRAIAERQTKDVLFISDTNRSLRQNGIHQHVHSTGRCNSAILPSLRARADDVPLLVNQLLLDHRRTRLDEVRHSMAGILMLAVSKAEISGNLEWLKAETRRWIEEFSPETSLPEAKEEPHGPTQQLAGAAVHGKSVDEKAAVGEYVFREEGDRFTIIFEGGEPFYLDNIIPLKYIAYLLRHREEVFPVSKLRKIIENKIPPPDPHYGKMGTEELAEEGLVKTGSGVTDDGIDKTGEYYRNRLKKLARDRAEAEDDPLVLREIDDEEEGITRQMSVYFDLKGQQRGVAPEVERDRKYISMNISRAKTRVLKKNKKLWKHLNLYIRPQGYAYSYSPDPPIRWIT